MVQTFKKTYIENKLAENTTDTYLKHATVILLLASYALHPSLIKTRASVTLFTTDFVKLKCTYFLFTYSRHPSLAKSWACHQPDLGEKEGQSRKRGRWGVEGLSRLQPWQLLSALTLCSIRKAPWHTVIGGPSSKPALGLGGKRGAVCRKEGVNTTEWYCWGRRENLLDIASRFCLKQNPVLTLYR